MDEVKKPRVSAKGRRQKGNRFENDVAKALGGKRVPLSGAAKHLGKEFAEDVVLPDGRLIQCKTLRDGWRSFYRWLETASIVAVRANNKEALIVLPLSAFAPYLLKEWEQRGGKQ